MLVPIALVPTRSAPGSARLLDHRHDDRLSDMHNALVRGELKADGDHWALIPTSVVEPMGSGRPRAASAVRLPLSPCR
ncbi:hypothetical protein ACWCOZ_13280 [Streptomyces sp. NPDC001840]